MAGQFHDARTAIHLFPSDNKCVVCEAEGTQNLINRGVHCQCHAPLRGAHTSNDIHPSPRHYPIAVHLRSKIHPQRPVEKAHCLLCPHLHEACYVSPLRSDTHSKRHFLREGLHSHQPGVAHRHLLEFHPKIRCFNKPCTAQRHHVFLRTSIKELLQGELLFPFATDQVNWPRTARFSRHHNRCCFVGYRNCRNLALRHIVFCKTFLLGGNENVIRVQQFLKSSPAMNPRRAIFYRVPFGSKSGKSIIKCGVQCQCHAPLHGAHTSNDIHPSPRHYPIAVHLRSKIHPQRPVEKAHCLLCPHLHEACYVSPLRSDTHSKRHFLREGLHSHQPGVAHRHLLEFHPKIRCFNKPCTAQRHHVFLRTSIKELLQGELLFPFATNQVN
mmetsp:Transcript_23034/g.59214  ORF Transcript_23034/g.59214 Transcript_23034/m.59214 type:complete len:384 (+) Transcript_23034:1126-2277(+)